VRRSRRDGWRPAKAVVVLPDAAHEIDGRDLRVLVAFIEPESELGRAVSAKATVPLRIVPDVAARRWRRLLGASATPSETAVRNWIERELTGRPEPTTIHPAVAGVMRMLRNRKGNLGDTSINHLAGLARLSPSRFGHVFTGSTGIPLRRYLLWLRVQRAALALVSGHSATEAAYIAGFADAAHLSRTFRRMLGCPPREMIRRQKDVQQLLLEERDPANK